MKKLFLFLVALFSFLSLSAGWGADLCEDETCSGHGECQDDAENEWCDCDEGYIADGMECILGCNGVTCSGHGVCSVVSGAEVCTCEAGFYATGLNCILNEASTVDTLAILNETDCYNTGNCHYRLIFATGAYDFTPALSSLYDIIVNVLDSENVWHNYRKTVAQCVTEGVCDNVDAQYIDFWFQHNVSGNQYVAAELLGNGDDASDDMYHDVLIDYCYGVNCGTGGSCNGTSGYPVCTCEEGYILRSGVCEEGWFEDENLAAAVIELLQYKGYDIETETDIEPEMLEGITHLPLRGRNISSLAGIGLFTSLTVLDVSENNISDLSPLSECSGLKILNISGNPANDLTPLGTLPLVSLDISYSGVYNLNPLVPVSTLTELILADTENSRYGIVGTDNISVQEKLSSLNLSGCNEIILYEREGNTGKFAAISKSSGCRANGSCVSGICVCAEGYVRSEQSNSCFLPDNCGEGYHRDTVSGSCVRDMILADCVQNYDTDKFFPDNTFVWNGTDYVMPAGYTARELCRINDTECDNDNVKSICRWQCKTGYTWVRDDICAPDTEKMIPDSAYNQMILPNIARRDVTLEPIPGVPSFAPVLKAGMYYDANGFLVAGWHFDFPRVELNIESSALPLSPEWDQQRLFVYMPWGREEYSIEAEKECSDSDSAPVDCKSSGAASVKVTYYPAPGQNIFSYIVLETTKDAYRSNFGTSGNNIQLDKDSWKITRYGDDGSVTEFERKQAKRPAYYEFMDYIPISKHTTRDKKETLFQYDWDIVLLNNRYSHYKLSSATITDPLKRVIKIQSYLTSGGLGGRPDSEHKVLYEPLEGSIEILVGKADSNGNFNSEDLKTAVIYADFNGFSMEAQIYKDNEYIYRADQYLRQGNSLSLKSYLTNLQLPVFSPEILVGQTIWNIPLNNGSGYTERKLVDNDSQEYIVKTVKGKYYPASRQKTYPVKYSLSISENENLQYKTVTIYSHEKNGVTDNEKRMVEDYFTGWLQPAKRVTCAYNENETCASDAGAVIEEIKYNVFGSPIYFRNADNQVTVNFYNTTEEVSPQHYTRHYFLDPLSYSNAPNGINILDSLVRADNLLNSGTPACSAVYSLDAGENFDGMLLQYMEHGAHYNAGWCSNTENHRATNYTWTKQSFGQPYDLRQITYPDGKIKTFTLDYEMGGFFDQNSQPAASVLYIPNGKVWGETVTGSNSQNTLQTCYAYNGSYQLTAQGIGSAESCDYKKGFGFDSSGLLMTRDVSYNGNTEVLPNDYIYDNLGRKIVERNSAGVSTLYVYDSLDRVVFTFFGCSVGDSVFFNRVYEPYDFNGSDSAGDDGLGVVINNNSLQFPYSENAIVSTSANSTAKCEYYRKYKYDEMSNLVETYFFEYWGVNQNNQIVPLTSPRIIKQETEYDMIGRAVKSCQYDTANPSDKRCIETEHDAFGNIVKKSENGEERVITYDHRNRPLTVTVDGLQTEQYFYNNAAAGNYFGYDAIKNKYEKTVTTYKDKWGRAAKSVDPFGNETVTTYESSYSDNITSQITTTSSSVKTAETTWTYDDLDRKLTETRKQFIPGSESTTNVNHQTWWEYDGIGNVVSVESSDGTKQTYSYDTLNRPVETINYEKINSNWVEASSSENFYDAQGRLFRTETTKDNKTIREDYGFDTFGRITSVKTTDPANSSRYRVKFYNTGGQVIWEADEESDADPRSYSDLGLWNVEVGNQKYYTYNAFGDLEKTVYVMTNTGIGLDETPDPNPWLNDGQITTNFTYDIFGRITSRTNDRSGVTAYSYYDENPGTSHSLNKLRSIQITPAVDNNSNYTDKTQTYTYSYDEYGDEASVEYTEGNSYSMEVAFTRDDYGRIISKTSNGSVPVTQTFTYNMRNLLETATDTVGNASTSVTRLYDSFGNPYSESVTANNATKTVSRRMTDAKTYQFTYPDGKTLRKTATGNDLDSIEYNNSEIASYSRANGVLTAITKGQNLIETFSYNNWNMLDNHTVSNANADVYDMTYNYSRGWHLTEKADGLRNTSDKYSYDSYYRLKEVKYDFANNTAARTDSFYQDGVHNIEQSTENGTTFAWGVDKLNRLRDKKVGGNTAVTYKYDKRNNMIGEDFDGSEPTDISYIYDDLNRLIEVQDGSNQTIATYTYDAFNRRITKTVGSTTERYSYDDWDIVEISTNSNNYTNIIDSGTDRHIAIEVTENNTSTLYYFLTDERGNVTALTDANGNILERYRYRVYGDFEILDAQFTPKNCNNQTCYSTNLHNFLWGGSLYEPETGLYWMRNRYYHIDMHRFINQDPIGIWGDANNLGNSFAYVAGMVIEASDPSGLEYTSDDELGKSILAKGNETSEYFAELNSNGNGKIIIVDGKVPKIKKADGSWDQPEGACFINGNIYIERKVAEEGMRVTRPGPLGGVTTESYHVSPEAAVAHEMAEREERENIAKEEAKDKNIKNLTKKEILEKEIENERKAHKKGIKAEKIVMDQQGEKQEEEETKKKGGEQYPSDPDYLEDKSQSYFANQFIKKILEMREKKNFFEMIDEVGPVIKYEDNGRKVFIFNPYYRGKDPMKQTYWKTKNADGTNGFVRNPFAPGAEYGYDSTTYEKFQQSGFPQTNVDPFWY